MSTLVSLGPNDPRHVRIQVNVPLRDMIPLSALSSMGAAVLEDPVSIYPATALAEHSFVVPHLESA